MGMYHQLTNTAPGCHVLLKGQSLGCQILVKGYNLDSFCKKRHWQHVEMLVSYVWAPLF